MAYTNVLYIAPEKRPQVAGAVALALLLVLACSPWLASAMGISTSDVLALIGASLLLLGASVLRYIRPDIVDL